MSCNHELDLVYWPIHGDTIPGDALPFCYECRHCHKTHHEIWMAEGAGYAKAVNEGRYPKESPVPLRRLTEAELKEMEQKQVGKGSYHKVSPFPTKQNDTKGINTRKEVTYG